MNQNGGSGDIQRQYDDCIRSLDNNIRELVTAVDDLRVSSRTLIVIVADRGQSLGEHGILCQSRGLYDCTLRVPLILRWPERITPGVRLPQMLQTHDLAAALVEAAGLPSRSTMEQEHSFWKLLAQEPAAGRDQIFSVDSSGQTQWCLRTRNHKFIVSREPNGSEASSRELYDLTADPEEKHNLANDRPDVAASMQAELEEIARRLREKNEDPWSEVGVALTRGV